jgi:hypothetical protein
VGDVHRDWEKEVGSVLVSLRALQFRPRASKATLTPAMAAGVTDRLWSIGELIEAAASEEGIAA